MDILPGEIQEIKNVGSLFGGDVKMIYLKGGLHLFVGKKKKNANKSETLAASSHAAIGMHQIEKDFGADFEPALAKSEHDALPAVENKSKYLPSEQLEKGVELYVLSKKEKVEVVLYKHGLTLAKYEAKASKGSLELQKREINTKLIQADKRTAEAMSRAIKDKMHEMGLNKVVEKWSK